MKDVEEMKRKVSRESFDDGDDSYLSFVLRLLLLLHAASAIGSFTRKFIRNQFIRN